MNSNWSKVLSSTSLLLLCIWKKHKIDNIWSSLSHGLDANMHGKWARISCQHMLHLNLADLLSRKTSFSRIASIRTNDGSPICRAKEVASAKWHSFCSWLNLPMAAKSLKTPFINSRERVVASNQNKFSLIHLLYRPHYQHFIHQQSLRNKAMEMTKAPPWRTSDSSVMGRLGSYAHGSQEFNNNLHPEPPDQSEATITNNALSFPILYR